MGVHADTRMGGIVYGEPVDGRAGGQMVYSAESRQGTCHRVWMIRPDRLTVSMRTVQRSIRKLIKRQKTISKNGITSSAELFIIAAIDSRSTSPVYNSSHLFLHLVAISMVLYAIFLSHRILYRHVLRFGAGSPVRSRFRKTVSLKKNLTITYDILSGGGGVPQVENLATNAVLLMMSAGVHALCGLNSMK